MIGIIVTCVIVAIIISALIISVNTNNKQQNDEQKEKKKIKLFGKIIKYNLLGCIDPLVFFNIFPSEYRKYFMRNNFILKKYLWSENIFFNSDGEEYYLFDNYIYEKDFNFIEKKDYPKLFFGKFERDFCIYQKMRVRFLEIYPQFNSNEKIEIKIIIKEIDAILINYSLKKNNILKESYRQLYNNFYYREEDYEGFLKLKQIILKIFKNNRCPLENYVNIGREKEIKKLELEISELQKKINTEKKEIFAQEYLKEFRKKL